MALGMGRMVLTELGGLPIPTWCSGKTEKSEWEKAENNGPPSRTAAVMDGLNGNGKYGHGGKQCLV